MAHLPGSSVRGLQWQGCERRPGGWWGAGQAQGVVSCRQACVSPKAGGGGDDVCAEALRHTRPGTAVLRPCSAGWGGRGGRGLLSAAGAVLRIQLSTDTWHLGDCEEQTLKLVLSWQIGGLRCCQRPPHRWMLGPLHAAVAGGGGKGASLLSARPSCQWRWTDSTTTLDGGDAR